jgi:hypothetical protein
MQAVDVQHRLPAHAPDEHSEARVQTSPAAFFAAQAVTAQ